MNFLNQQPFFTFRCLYTSFIAILLHLAGLAGLQAATIEAPTKEQETLTYLKKLSIEELLQTEITSVSKKSEQLFSVAAAISVITQEDIQRAGIHSIPEALRLVPGLQVAHIDSSRWAVSSRGFNEYFANKLLVLIDGRSTYTPLFSGVYWNTQDTIIEDIDHIEIIRGPGATVWGANAVNGVINIITKKSEDTQGGLVSAVAGTHEQPLVSARYGGRIDARTTYRLYLKGLQREGFDHVDGGDANDSWQSIRTGFRLDNQLSPKDAFSVQGEIHDGEADGTLNLSTLSTSLTPGTITDTETFRGGHILMNWQHHFTAASTTDIQIYYDRTVRDQLVATETRDTIDLDFKHHLDPNGAHDIVWGGGYRWTTDNIAGTRFTAFIPDHRNDSLWSAFFQDDITLVKDTAWLTIGSKLEHNAYTGFEFQPSIRLRLQPTPRQMLWGAVSRAVRTPSRGDHNIEVNFGATTDAAGNLSILRLLGNENFSSEELTAYEIGYRWQAAEDLSFDLATYYNDYDNIRSVETGMPFPETSPLPPHLVIPNIISNGLEGKTYGLEIQGTWQATEKWKLFAGYSWLEMDLHYKDPLLASTLISEETLSPQHQIYLRSYLDLPHRVSLDSELYYVSELDSGNIEPYLRFDLRLAWHPQDNIELSIGAENLFGSGHQEFPDRTNIIASEVPSQYWAKVTYTF